MKHILPKIKNGLAKHVKDRPALIITSNSDSLNNRLVSNIEAVNPEIGIAVISTLGSKRKTSFETIDAG